jgi:hypothetical protein
MLFEYYSRKMTNCCDGSSVGTVAAALHTRKFDTTRGLLHDDYPDGNRLSYIVTIKLQIAVVYYDRV